MSIFTKLNRAAAIAAILLSFAGSPADDTGHEAGGHSLGLSDEVMPLEDFGQGLNPRPRTLSEVVEDKIHPENVERLEMLENRAQSDTKTEIPERKTLFGDRFLSSGPLLPGIESGTGAKLRPSFVTFGTLRSALQTYEAPGGERTTEWANRLDLFGNVYFTSTERFLFGFRPLDEDGVFTGVAGGPGVSGDTFRNGLNLEPTTFFFEGDLSEMFPHLDPWDRKSLDYQFSIGRQPLFLQDGILVNDNIDALGITRHNLFRMNASATRLTAFVGFNEVHRGNNVRDSHANLYALSGSFDYPDMTIEADVAYVNGAYDKGGDGLFFGIGHLSTFGYWHSAFRVNASFALSREDSEAVSDGWLFTHQLSRTMRHSEDILTFSSFYEIDNYTSAARGPSTGGPLGGFSLLQRAVGIGTYGPPIVNGSGDLVGVGVTYQHFLDDREDKQIAVAVGGSGSTDSDEPLTGALAVQYQQALSENLIWSLGGYGSITDEGDKGFGVRTEMTRKF